MFLVCARTWPIMVKFSCLNNNNIKNNNNNNKKSQLANDFNFSNITFLVIITSYYNNHAVV